VSGRRIGPVRRLHAEAPRGGSAVGKIDDGDRPVGIVQDLPAHRPEQDPADQALAVRADDDQLRIAGMAQDCFGGAALHRDVLYARRRGLRALRLMERPSDVAGGFRLDIRPDPREELRVG